MNCDYCANPLYILKLELKLVIAGRVDATSCSKLTGGMPPVPPALTRGLLQMRFFQKRTKMRAQIHTGKFEKLMAWGQVPCWGLFLTSKESSGLVGPCGCQKWTPVRHPLSSYLFFKFSDVTLGSDFDPFWENLICTDVSKRNSRPRGRSQFTFTIWGG